MNLQSLTLTACISSGLFYLPIQASSKKFSAANNSHTQIQTQYCADCNNFCTIEQLKSLAKSITVKVISGNGWGSGVILKRQGQVYTVVTNQHVLDTGKSYLIQTPDGHFYNANQIKTDNFQENDLALLQFHSPDPNYVLASLAASASLSPGDKIFTAGFPAITERWRNEETQDKTDVNQQNYPTDTQLLFTRGRLSILSERPLEKGYQIGYSNVVKKGMSGGPLLNIHGQVVGINGMHAYPLWGNPYVYRDGSQPSFSLRQQMSRLAFAIPTETLAKLAPKFASIPPIKVDKSASSKSYNHFLFPDFIDVLAWKFSLPVLPPSCVSQRLGKNETF